jgi:hypothetical protein
MVRWVRWLDGYDRTMVRRVQWLDRYKTKAARKEVAQ